MRDFSPVSDVSRLTRLNETGDVYACSIKPKVRAARINLDLNTQFPSCLRKQQSIICFRKLGSNTQYLEVFPQDLDRAYVDGVLVVLEMELVVPARCL